MRAFLYPSPLEDDEFCEQFQISPTSDHGEVFLDHGEQREHGAPPLTENQRDAALAGLGVQRISPWRDTEPGHAECDVRPTAAMASWYAERQAEWQARTPNLRRHRR
ncbi:MULTISPECIES: hypothetical protein [unclassified Crossiella]|uniref:hypothetical protein n=1 Tax=unclassified Crossiella TaxID=2620835 RepID=UPI001FFF261F|nr:MULTISPECIES: hypothetical protein [unclassified Crossiella]MCK2245432.1 hypothetical protein [Crossiella sp. S99.2]MCK2259084.1 hypothetical protein [Crossiella sp. S99.1]